MHVVQVTWQGGALEPVRPMPLDRHGRLECHHFAAGRCRSCTHLATPYLQQLRAKQDDVAARLAEVAGAEAIDWLPPVASAPARFRNKAKLAVSGTAAEPRLGIVDPRGGGVDLRDCGLHEPAVRDALPALAGFITQAALVPYDVPARRGELKHVLVTASPDGELMVRFVLRSTESLPRLRKHLPTLLERLPHLRVVSANLQPEHKAVLEGPDEIVLTPESSLLVRLDDAALHLRPQSFFQTNTAVARRLYGQARRWADELAPRSVWDLYCGVGGFALHLAAPGRAVVGVEVAEQAVLSARRSAEEAGVCDVRFETGDATAFATAQPAPADLVVVNPPRRGIGAELAGWLEASGAPAVIYSSCNVESLARDLAAMPSLRPRRARLLDMFPHTGHHEVVVLLQR